MESGPFLRWIGGKTKTVKVLAKFVPNSFNCYWEPFLGGGSMFFWLEPKKAFLSDDNKDLITCYQAVKESPIALSNEVESHRINHSENYYYQIRKYFNEGGNDIEQAGRFIYLNKASFNGIYRVNKEGKFNVPYGGKLFPSLPNFQKINLASELLRNAEIKRSSFEKIVDWSVIKQDDFIYFDPPYPPINEKSNFNHYTQEKFGNEDQYRVASLANELDRKYCKVMISNADTPEIRKLYKNWNIITLPVVRWVSANGERKCVNELVIFNYRIEEG